MIGYDERTRVFTLSGKTDSYAFAVLPTGHLAHLYWGPLLPSGTDLEPLLAAVPGVGWTGSDFGNTTGYSKESGMFALQRTALELSGRGKGDYRPPTVALRSGTGDRSGDWTYRSHRIRSGAAAVPGLPHAVDGEAGPDGRAETLEVECADEAGKTTVTLFYTIFPDCDCLVRSLAVRNDHPTEEAELEIVRAFTLDLSHDDRRLLSLDGAWLRERRHGLRETGPGSTLVESRYGVSSSAQSPSWMLCDPKADERSGEAVAVSLIYSGSHCGGVHVNEWNSARLFSGLHPECFRWRLAPGESFHSPQAALVRSGAGIGGASAKLHRFIGNHIVRGPWRDRERPVLFNSWEAVYFDFDERKILDAAKGAKELGGELFVLDDGWFGRRDDDTSSLGDWSDYRKKLPGGLERLAGKIRSLGLDFGIWMEPEMISEDSELFRAHPEYRVSAPGRTPSPGRNQFLLDLVNPAVRDHVAESVRSVLERSGAAYLKWDMNRNFSDCFSPLLPKDRQGEFEHRWMLGLYAVLERTVEAFPEVLFESCASGGNRFDLGMLRYMPQVWTSDDSDAWERVPIQYGTSLFAPPSTMACHVSAAPNHQVLRNTPLESRFNAAAFGVLGYELDPARLSKAERTIVERQIRFYKERRRLFQFGVFERLRDPSALLSGGDRNSAAWSVRSADGAELAAAFFRRNAEPNPPPARLPLPGADRNRAYRVEGRRQYTDIRPYGDLVRRLFPVPLKLNGIAYNRIADSYVHELDRFAPRTVSGALLSHPGLPLPQEFYGTGQGPEIALLGDFGSRMLIAEAEETEETT